MAPKQKAAASSDGLFTWMDALWTKAEPEGTPPTFMMHRFLASDIDLAPACRALGLEVREPALVFKTWQGLLPKGPGAPRLGYAAPKKPPQEEALVTRMREVTGERRAVIEEHIALARLAGHVSALYAEFGVEEEE